MPIPSWSDADFTRAILSLLPRGRAWAKDTSDTMAQALSVLGPTYARGAARAAYLLTDAFPGTTVELMTEWEETVGLPGPYASLDLSNSEMQGLIAARVAGSGGQSIPWFTAFAATLGYTITVTEFAPFRVGMTVGQAINGQDWAFAWQVDVPAVTVNYFEVGRDTTGEAFATWQTTVLQKELERLKPAHTVLIFNFI